jgi:integral membrane protein (TIGR01906 family)
MKLIPKVFIGFSAIPLLFALLLFGTAFMALSPSVYFSEYDKLHQEVTIGCDRETLDAIAVDLIDYMAGRRDTLDGVQGYIMGDNREAFSERDKEHMVDVKNLFIAARYGILAGVVLFAGLLVIFVPHLNKGRRAHTASSCFLVGVVAFFVLVGVLAIVIASNFESAFTQFHLLFFDNDLWMLPSYSVLLQMMPTQFFVDMATNIGVFFAVGTLAIVVVAVAIRQLSGWLKLRATGQDDENGDDGEDGGGNDVLPEEKDTGRATFVQVPLEHNPLLRRQPVSTAADASPAYVEAAPATFVQPEIATFAEPEPVEQAQPLAPQADAVEAVPPPAYTAAVPSVEEAKPVASAPNAPAVARETTVVEPIVAVQAEDGERFVLNNAGGVRPDASDIFEQFGLSDADDQPLMPDEATPAAVSVPARPAQQPTAVAGSIRIAAEQPAWRPQVSPVYTAPPVASIVPIAPPPIAPVVPAMPSLFPLMPPPSAQSPMVAAYQRQATATKDVLAAREEDGASVEEALEAVVGVAEADEIERSDEINRGDEIDQSGEIVRVPTTVATMREDDEPITLHLPVRLPSSILESPSWDRGLRVELSIQLADDLRDTLEYRGGFPDSVEEMKRETLAAMMRGDEEPRTASRAQMMEAALAQMDILIEGLPAVEG